jgi:hypothetical protein
MVSDFHVGMFSDCGEVKLYSFNPEDGGCMSSRMLVYIQKTIQHKNRDHNLSLY